MKLDNLGKKLAKELSRNKKKSGILAVVCVVAIWFWAPLIGKWTGVGEKKPTNDVHARVIAPVGVAVNALLKQAGVDAAAKLNWRDVMKRVEDDDFMQPFTGAALKRDPFQAVEMKVANANETTPAVAVAEAPRRIEALGLELTSVIVTPRKRFAVISGNTYTLRDTIRIQQSSAAVVDEEFPPPRPAARNAMLTIHEIERRQVLLNWDGKLYPLRLFSAGE